MKSWFARSAALLLSVLGTHETMAADGQAMTAEARQAEGFWKTDYARFFDTRDLAEALAAVPDRALTADTGAGSPEAAADKIVDFLLAELKEGQGVHVETALSALGAMAGFSCQMTIRTMVKAGKVPAKDAFVVIQTKDGETYYGGDLLNEGLVSNTQGQYSVWAFVGGAVQHLGKPQPDLIEIFKHSAADIGSDRFGVPRVAAAHMPHQSNQLLLWKYWNVTRNILVVEKQPPVIWPFVLAMAAQRLIFKAKDVIDPTLAAQLVMEAAVPMSKIDPKHVYGAEPE